MKKDIFFRELTIEVVVGVFVVVVLFGLAYFTFVLSGKKFNEQTYEMVALFDDVMGLRTKDSVVARGMPIGEVKKLELDPAGVHVHMEVVGKKGGVPPVRMRKDYKIRIVSTSILGGRMLIIEEGSPEAGDLPMDLEFKGLQPHDLMGDAADLFSSLKKGLTEEGGVVESLKTAATNIRDISQRLNSGKGTLGKLLSEDDTLYNDLKSSTASLKGVLTRLEQGKGTMGKLFSEDEKVFDDLKAGVASLRKVSERIEQGKGTLGRLMSEDDALYRELSDVVQEAKAALDDLRETTPVVTFTSILFGAF